MRYIVASELLISRGLFAGMQAAMPQKDMATATSTFGLMRLVDLEPFFLFGDPQ